MNKRGAVNVYHYDNIDKNSDAEYILKTDFDDFVNDVEETINECYDLLDNKPILELGDNINTVVENFETLKRVLC